MSASLDVAARGTHNAPTVGLRTRMRSAGVWIVGVAVVLLTVIVTMLLGDDGQPADPLHFDSTQRDGTKALIETLRDHGTQVSTTEDAQEARQASAVPGTTLLILTGAEGLSRGDVDGLTSALASQGNRLVLVDPGVAVARFTARLAADADSDPLAQPDATSPPDCPLPAARAAGEVSTGQTRYEPVDGATVCYPFTGPGVDEQTSPAGQLVVDDGGRFPVTVLGNPAWVSNGTITEDGNAALALSTLSQTDRLVVYYPRPDASGDAPPSTLDYVPDWFIAGTVWMLPCLIVVLLVAGRRFGPLAVERLPVVVPAVETVHGRAALAERSGDRLGALHALRTAALLRIARRLALSSEAGREEILARMSATTGRDPTQLRTVFVTAVPADDRELTALVDLISTIESEIP